MQNELYEGYKKEGITSLDELKGLEVVRTEFTSSVFRPKVTINLSSISFNKACVQLLPGVQYVNILIDREEKADYRPSRAAIRQGRVEMVQHQGRRDSQT